MIFYNSMFCIIQSTLFTNCEFNCFNNITNIILYNTVSNIIYYLV